MNSAATTITHDSIWVSHHNVSEVKAARLAQPPPLTQRQKRENHDGVGEHFALDA